MKPTPCGQLLFSKAKCPLADATELQTVLEDAKEAAAAGGVWRTVRLLVSAARCTLRAGRGDLALPLVTTAFELSPEPFSGLASLQREDGTGDSCAVVHSFPAAAELQKEEGDVPAVLCTALMVWHGALASAVSPSSCPRDFLRFSHVVGHILTTLTLDAVVFGSLSVCWFYNTLTFFHRSNNARAVASYLLEELHDEVPLVELKETSDWRLVCSVGKNACVRAGFCGPQVMTMWNRLCVTLYTEGCALLQAAQEDVCRHASGAIEILKAAFDGESTHYLPHFRRLPRLSPHDVTRLCDIAVGTNLSVTRETFTPFRMACWLRCLAEKRESASPVNFPLASLSSVVALALRHRYNDIAAEILRVGLAASSGDDPPLLWGEELRALLDRALEPAEGGGKDADCGRRWRAAAQQDASEPLQLLHEVAQGQSAADLLPALVLSESLDELLPIALAVIRGDEAFGCQLLGDKIAAPLFFDGLTRLILCLVDEGDLPLARCFLPLTAGICERMPSQANLFATLHAIAAFVQRFPQDIDADDQQQNVAAAFRSFIPPRRPGASPPYRQTKAAVVGRTFSSRRRVFESFCKNTPLSANTSCHCQLQVLFTRDYEGVRLLRKGSVEGAMQWEKVLPVGRTLLRMVARMREIELENRRHLDAASKKKKTSLLAGEQPCAAEEFADVEIEGPNKEERDEWWKKRYTLDRALKEVVETMQSDEIFGCWRLAMCGDLPPSCLSELESLAARLLQEISAPARHVADVTLILAGLPFLSARCSLDDRLWFSPSHGNTGITCASCDEVLLCISQALENELIKQDIAKSSSGVVNTSRWASRCALSILWTAAACEQQQGSEHRDLLGLPRTPLYLVLDNELHCLPFEGVDVLWTSSVARVPTAAFVSTTNTRSTALGDGLVYCAIDPSGVMPKTLKRLLPVCQRNGWKVRGQNISSGKLLHEIYLSQARLYVYVGHGKGEHLLHREELYERFPDAEKFPAVFLMGCSSAYMDSGSSYDCYGMPYAFLHAGCPLFLGCLWHVTDGEIDRLTKRLLLLIAGEKVDGVNQCARFPMTVGEALVLARRACRLPFLTGCAAVLYGINLPLQGGELRGT